jgi:hypothetical protein
MLTNTLPGLAATLDLKLTSQRDPGGEHPFRCDRSCEQQTRDRRMHYATQRLSCSGNLRLPLGCRSLRPNVKDEPRRDRRGSCGIQILGPTISFVIRDDSTRRDDPGVGSGALLGCMVGLEIELF